MTKGSTIAIQYSGFTYLLDVTDVKPADAVSIIEADVEVRWFVDQVLRFNSKNGFCFVTLRGHANRGGFSQLPGKSKPRKERTRFYFSHLALSEIALGTN
jgi:hypothetical protein